MDERPQTVSLLGDSISTYEGYAPFGYAVYYTGDRLFDNDLKSVHDTWWMRVIDAWGATLLVNASFSGSTVSGMFFPAACTKERCTALSEGGASDLVLIYMGTNDRGRKIPLGKKGTGRTDEFFGAYRRMLREVRINCPRAKIVCATLPSAYLRGHREVVSRDDPRYNEAIAAVAEEEGCILADLAAFEEPYETLDLLHPTKEGHALLAELFLRALGLR